MGERILLCAIRVGAAWVFTVASIDVVIEGWLFR